jgi:hypothetical protein
MSNNQGEQPRVPRPSLPRSRSKLSPTAWVALIERYHQGEKANDLALETGISASRIRERAGRR